MVSWSRGSGRAVGGVRLGEAGREVQRAGEGRKEFVRKVEEKKKGGRGQHIETLT